MKARGHRQLFFTCLNPHLLPFSRLMSTTRSSTSLEPSHHSVHDSTRSQTTSRTAGESNSRIYILGRKKEEEISISEALRALRAYSIRNTPETVAVNIKVDMTLKKDKFREPFKGPISLPHNFGRERIILFVSESSYHDIAVKAGVDIVRTEDVFPELEEESVNFDICLTTPTMLDRFKPLQRILKAKIPNIRRGTVVSEDSIAQAVQQFKTSREFKCDKIGNIHLPIGKLDFLDDHIVTNITSVLDTVITYHGNIPKLSFIQSVLLSSTYGPAFPITTRTLL